MNPETVRKWLEFDPRRVQPALYTSIYPLTVDIIIKKTQCLLPINLIKGKRVLDLGAGIPYFELWCNQNNAHYTGVEIQKETFIKGKKLINTSNILFHDSIENFLDYSDLSSYDIIVCSSTLHLVNDYMKYFNKLLHTQKILIIEEDLNDIKEAVLSVRANVPNYTDNPAISVHVQKYHATPNFLKHHMLKAGYSVEEKPYELAMKILPQWFGSKKFFIHGIPNKNKSNIKTMQEREWGNDSSWTDSINDYSYIISSIPKILKELKINNNDAILDFGCRIGHCLRSLRYAGFNNLHGIDKDQILLDRCPQDIANLSCSEVIDHKKYQVIIINWSVEVKKDQLDTLKTLLSATNKGGYVLLSAKVDQKDDIENYHKMYNKLNLKYRLYNFKLNSATWILTV